MTYLRFVQASGNRLKTGVVSENAQTRPGLTGAIELESFESLCGAPVAFTSQSRHRYMLGVQDRVVQKQGVEANKNLGFRHMALGADPNKKLLSFRHRRLIR